MTDSLKVEGAAKGGYRNLNNGSLTVSLADLRGRLVEDWLAGRSPRTVRAYRQGLADFADWLGVESIDAAAVLLLALPHGEANATVHRYRGELLEQGRAPATVNLRLAALASLVRLARTFGITPWSLEVPRVKTEPSRDTAGPGREAIAYLLAALKSEATGGSVKGFRDFAICRLLADLGLRRGSVVGLDLQDVDLDAATVAVMLKGQHGKKSKSLPPPTVTALRGWIEQRGLEPGPLFYNLSRAGERGRLSGRGLAKMVEKRSLDILGIRLRPHAFRHTAATLGLDLTGGDLRAVAALTEHKHFDTLRAYDDARQDLGGKVSKLIADAYNV